MEVSDIKDYLKYAHTFLAEVYKIPTDSPYMKDIRYLIFMKDVSLTEIYKLTNNIFVNIGYVGGLVGFIRDKKISDIID